MSQSAPADPSAHVFISRASADDAFVADLRQALEAHRVPVWVDSRNLRGGSKLAPEVAEAIESARQVLVVLSPSTVNSPWVRREIKKALEVEERRKEEGYRVIPLLLPGITPRALENWFDEEPVGVPVRLESPGVSEALPAVLAALGERLPTDHRDFARPEAKPLEELILTLTDPRIETHAGARRVSATATLTYEPADPAARPVESRRYTFTAPLGPIEADELRWYLESYFLWPTGVFRTRAEGIEQKLPQWGRDLFRAALGAEAAREALTAWQHAAAGAERRFSVLVDSDPPEGASEDARAAAREAAAELLALPWELLHDGRGWLFQGKQPARVRRRLPNRERKDAAATGLPIRILLLSPRPERDEEGNPIGYIDHRVSALPVVEAAEGLGELVRLTVLAPPTYGALERALQEAAERGEPFDVVHFDGHGAYDRRVGLGGLCFEDPKDVKDASKLERRTMEFVGAGKLAGLFRQHRVPLVFLEACQTAMSQADPTASVAGRLLEEGVTSVVAMSHSVLVETARRFGEAFYAELARGARVGQAMLAGQRALFADAHRGKVMGAGDLRLQDWFVPVIYQEEQDPQLVTRTPPEEVRQLEAERRQLALGNLPAPPSYRFHGRSRELLALERLLEREPWAVVRGVGGSGKTTLAAELARWLARTRRFERAAFVSLERHRDARAVLDTLGHQLLPEGDTYSVAQFRDLKAALQPVERALAEQPTIVVVDNCESVLPLPEEERSQTPSDASAQHAVSTTEPEAADSALAGILSLCKSLLAASPATRLLFTSRESLPAPFAHRGRERELGALERQDAIELVAQVMAEEGLAPEPGDAGSTPQEVTDLVDAVNRHPRALVLLAREVARRGVKGSTAELRALMAELERKHPGDRENSLYASVALSLGRLSAESRERVKVLGVCHGGVHLGVLSHLTGLEMDDARGLGAELIDVGLGEDMGYFHLRLDPGLPPYLLGEITTAEVEAVRARWAEAMAELTQFLYQEQFKNTQIAAHLTPQELPSLLAMLDWLEVHGPPEQVAELAYQVEGLVADLGRPQALAKATRVRERAAQKLGEWSHARVLTESATIERLSERGDLPTARDAAQRLLRRCLDAGEAAYPDAPYDTAMAHFRLGRVLKQARAAEAALESLAEAQRRFQRLADAGDTRAERMVDVVITDVGDCLQNLGRLSEAAAIYEEAIERSQAQGRVRDVAVGKGQLGSVRLLQKRYDEALKIFSEARDAFAALGEPRSVATAWHHIGVVHTDAGDLELAEQALRRSLAIKVQENDVAGQGASLHELGTLYRFMGRLEEAVAFYQQGAEAYERLHDRAAEGLSRHNLADTLVHLTRFDEARREVERALECTKGCGHAARIWTTWSILEELERRTGHAEAALAARQEAIQTYLAYRRAGGDSESDLAGLFELVAHASRQHSTHGVDQHLTNLAGAPDAPALTRTVAAKLRSFLAGGRNAEHTADLELPYMEAAELQLVAAVLSSTE